MELINIAVVTSQLDGLTSLVIVIDEADNKILIINCRVKAKKRRDKMTCITVMNTYAA